MKRTALIVAAILLITGLAYAGTADDMGITLKQGMVMDWSSARMKNLTTFEAAKTKPVPTWGKWNALWAGWTLDAGFAYDASAIDTVAAIGWAKMPERVTDVEARVGKTEDQVQQLAASVDKYIAVQAEQKKADKEKEELLLRLIEKMSTK